MEANAPDDGAARAAAGTSALRHRSIADLLVRAEAKKAEGNAHVAAGEFRKAAFAYKLVHMFLGEHVPTKPRAGEGENDADGGGDNGIVNMMAQKQLPVDPRELEAARGVYAATQLNLSMVHLKLGRGIEAIAAADLAMRVVGQRTAKGLFRRACGRMAIGDPEKAKEDLLAALELAPGDEGILAKLAEVEAALQAATRKEAKMFAKMFQ